jgi:1-acyl-sn-glycerol-3-phosphate acyltransferase
MNDIARTAIAGLTTVGLTGGVSAAITALSFIDPKLANPLLYRWADTVLRVSGVKTRCEGLEHLPGTPFVLCVNHQSNFDSVVLFRHIRRHIRFVAKKQLRAVPIFGTALERAGNIFVDRDGGQGDKSRLSDASARVRGGTSVVFFAEGTRSDDGVLRPFKKGAAMMAIEAQVPLVPAAVAGTHRILEKGSVVIRPRPAALVIGTPLRTEGNSIEERTTLTEQAHAAVAALLARGNAMVESM